MALQEKLEDPYYLQRFVSAQDPVFGSVCAELLRGRKSGHWMWFIFPQLLGLGLSPMAVHYAIGSIAEAEAYLQHPVLGTRLQKCCELLLDIEGLGIEQIMDHPDDLKLRSSLTLFIKATQTNPSAALQNMLFRKVLKKYFGGELDTATLRLLQPELTRASSATAQ